MIVLFSSKILENLTISAAGSVQLMASDVLCFNTCSFSTTAGAAVTDNDEILGGYITGR